MLLRPVENKARKETCYKTRHHLNCIKLRINAADKSATPAKDKAIADAYGNKFIIPLGFEMLDSSTPYY